MVSCKERARRPRPADKFAALVGAIRRAGAWGWERWERGEVRGSEVRAGSHGQGLSRWRAREQSDGEGACGDFERDVERRMFRKRERPGGGRPWEEGRRNLRARDGEVRATRKTRRGGGKVESGGQRAEPHCQAGEGGGRPGGQEGDADVAKKGREGGEGGS